MPLTVGPMKRQTISPLAEVLTCFHELNAALLGLRPQELPPVCRDVDVADAAYGP